VDQPSRRALRKSGGDCESNRGENTAGNCRRRGIEPEVAHVARLSRNSGEQVIETQERRRPPGASQRRTRNESDQKHQIDTEQAWSEGAVNRQPRESRETVTNQEGRAKSACAQGRHAKHDDGHRNDQAVQR